LEFVMKTPSAALIIFSLTVSVAPISAHHTITAIYDTNKVVTLKGVVTEVNWQNPHVILHLDVKNGDGATTSWAIETRATNIVKRCGLNQDFVKAGETVSTDVLVAKDGARKAWLETITLPGGGTTRLSAASQPPVGKFCLAALMPPISGHRRPT
jgi:Family of unknown function (DUF6152)